MKGEEGVGGGRLGKDEKRGREWAAVNKEGCDGFKLWQKTPFVRDFSKEGWVEEEEEEGVKKTLAVSILMYRKGFKSLTK